MALPKGYPRRGNRAQDCVAVWFLELALLQVACVFGAPPGHPHLPLLTVCRSTGTASSCLEQVLNFPSFVECIPLNVVRMGILYVKPNSKPFLCVNSFSFTTLKSRYYYLHLCIRKNQGPDRLINLPRGSQLEGEEPGSCPGWLSR